MDPTRAFQPQVTQAMSAPPVVGPAGQVTTAMAPARALAARVVPGRPATMANGPAREAFLLELSAPTAPGLPGVSMPGQRTPLNLCLVIDRSGSMEGLPLEYVKQACSYVVDLLSPNDVLSIVTFEETVDVLMPPQRVTQKEPIKAGIARIQAGNTTNLYDGVSLAATQLMQVNDPGRVTRMVVLTDGDPTAGIKDFSALVQHAGEVKGRGISATFLGFGPEYNEELLAAMAKKAGGNYAYIARPELIPEVFRLELDKLLTVGATNLRLDIKLARWVRLRGLTGLPTPPGDREFTVPLADLERGAVLQQVLDLEFANHPLGEYRVAAGRLSYDDATTGRPETIDLDFVMEFTADAARYGVPVHPDVAQAHQMAQASRAVEQTIMGLKTGALNVTQAVNELQKTQMLLVQDGRVQEAQEVTLAMRALQSGQAGQAEKTLMGTVVNLDQGKKSASP